MRTILFASIGLLFMSFFEMDPLNENSFHQFKVQTLEGEDFSFESLKGKKVLIVNTASQCGYTPQYEELETLYKKYGGTHFEIIGFPCNDFGAQEPGSAEEIRSFCQKNYGVTFPLMEKVHVVGENQHPLYEWLSDKTLNGKLDTQVKWNFHKYLMNEDGTLVAEFKSSVSPLDDQITSLLKK